MNLKYFILIFIAFNPVVISHVVGQISTSDALINALEENRVLASQLDQCKKDAVRIRDSILIMHTGIRDCSDQERRLRNCAEESARLRKDNSEYREAHAALSSDLQQLETQLATASQRMEAVRQQLSPYRDTVLEIRRLEDERRIARESAHARLDRVNAWYEYNFDRGYRVTDTTLNRLLVDEYWPEYVLLDSFLRCQDIRNQLSILMGNHGNNVDGLMSHYTSSAFKARSGLILNKMGRLLTMSCNQEDQIVVKGYVNRLPQLIVTDFYGKNRDSISLDLMINKYENGNIEEFVNIFNAWEQLLGDDIFNNASAQKKILQIKFYIGCILYSDRNQIWKYQPLSLKDSWLYKTLATPQMAKDVGYGYLTEVVNTNPARFSRNGETVEWLDDLKRNCQICLSKYLEER